MAEREQAFAVLGLGSIGMRHARNLIALGQEVRGFDPAPERRAELISAGGIGFGTRAEALDGAVASIVASPNRFHLDDLAAVIDAGQHAFIEKPLAHTASGVSSILDQAKATGLVVFAGFMLRYHPCVERARRALTAGDIGDPWGLRAVCASWLPAWRPSQDYRQGYAADPHTGGVIFDICHEIDLACHLLGPAQILAATAGRSGIIDIAAEDNADILLRHTQGSRTNLHIDYLSRPPIRRTEISGRDGIIRIDLNARKYSHQKPDGSAADEAAFPGSWNDVYVSEMQDFLACIAGTSTPRCDGMTALEVLELTLAARHLAGLPQ